MSKRILVVEDQADNRQIIRDVLAPTDYEITEAENGVEALAAIAKQRPDLILMDIQLPIMDGYEATRRIKADASLRSIPIIAVTSYALSGEEKKARAAGCDDYVPKPFKRTGPTLIRLRGTPVGLQSASLMTLSPVDRSKLSKSTASRLRRYYRADGPCRLLQQSGEPTKLTSRAALLGNFETMGQRHFLPNTRQC